jgi:hypothetical protein
VLGDVIGCTDSTNLIRVHGTNVNFSRAPKAEQRASASLDAETGSLTCGDTYALVGARRYVETDAQVRRVDNRSKRGLWQGPDAFFGYLPTTDRAGGESWRRGAFVRYFTETISVHWHKSSVFRIFSKIPFEEVAGIVQTVEVALSGHLFFPRTVRRSGNAYPSNPALICSPTRMRPADKKDPVPVLSRDCDRF